MPGRKKKVSHEKDGVDFVECLHSIKDTRLPLGVLQVGFNGNFVPPQAWVNHQKGYLGIT